MEKDITFSDLVEKANGHWIDIIEHASSSQEMRDAIDRGHLNHGFCPVHGGKNGDAFRIFDDFEDTGGVICNTCGPKPNGTMTLMWLNNWEPKDVADCIKDYFGDHLMDPVKPVKKHVASKVNNKRKKRPPLSVLQKIWREAYRADDDRAGLLRAYLAGRGLSGIRKIPVTIRFHPNLICTHKGQSYGEHPAMIAAAMDINGQVTAIHRTYLAPGGIKADVPQKKKLLSSRDTEVLGSAIRLGDAGKILGVTEGIEDGLSAMYATRIPIWSLISSSFFPKVVIPEEVELVIIWADPDEAGRKYSKKLEERLLDEGKSVQVLFPPVKQNKDEDIDWNKVLITHGPGLFPYAVSHNEKSVKNILLHS